MENNKKKLSKKQIISFSAMGVIFAAVLAGNVVAGYFGEMITTYFYGSGVVFDNNKTFTEATAQSKKLNEKIAEEGIVMLRNENNALPLTKDELQKVNVFGWSSSPGGWVCGSDGSAASNSGTSRLKVKNILNVFDDEKVNIEYNHELSDMYTNFCDSRAKSGTSLLRALSGNPNYFMLIEPQRSAYDTIGENGKTILQNAKDFSSTALVVISRLGGEGCDLPTRQIKNDTGKKVQANSRDLVIDKSRTYLDISTEEEAMLQMVRDEFEKVVVIVNSCNEMNLSFLEDYNVDACITMNGLGENGAYAIPRILSGEINPSGKTTSIHTYDLTTDPTYMNAGGQTAGEGYVVYAEDIYVGYKWYETADVEGYWNNVNNEHGKGYDGVVQYPFGYGLSYSDFKWDVVSVEGKTSDGTIIHPGDDFINDKTTFTVKVRVTNTSEVPGRDVVELYYTPPYYKGQIEKSAVNLLAFGKTEILEKNQSQVIELTFTGYDMASYDCYDKNTNRNVGYELDRGDYVLSLRKNSHDIAEITNGTFTFPLAKTVRIANDPATNNRVTNRFTSYDVIAKQNDGTFQTQTINAYANNSIDGSDAAEADVIYLSRNDFASTFPKTKEKNRTGASVTNAMNYVYDGYDASVIPEINQGQTNTHHLLYVTESGGKPTKSQLNTGSGIKPNKELLLELGGNYDSPKWDELLNQMSVDDLSTLVNRGGYCTLSIESIGKKHMLENDGPSGLNRHNMEIDKTTSQNIDRSDWTMFSMPSVIGTSWNSFLAYSYGKSIGTEGVAVGVTGWYAPGANMQRSPFDGRNSEYYSEDSLLSGIMAAETSKGAMSMGMNVYVKHFAINETETRRDGLKTWLTEQTLREIYLRPFEIAVKRGKANGMMSSFNRIGSTWTGGNHALMTEILRDEWGFRGAVVTDYYSGLMKMNQGLKAGNDLWLTGSQTPAESFGSTTDKERVYFARKACKNILFASCNAYYMHENRDKSLDTIKVDLDTIVERELPKPWWILWGLLPLDLVTIGGLSTWAYFLLKNKKIKKVLEKNSEDLN